MGFVQILHGYVGRFAQGQVVAEEWFAGELERLFGVGAIAPVDDRDVPPEAIAAPATEGAATTTSAPVTEPAPPPPLPPPNPATPAPTADAPSSEPPAASIPF